MQAQLQRVEVEPARRRDDDLAVEHAAVRQRVEQRRVQLGKVAIERLEVAALDVDVAAAAKDDRAKAVPLRLERKVASSGKPSTSLASMGSIGGSIGKSMRSRVGFVIAAYFLRILNPA